MTDAFELNHKMNQNIYFKCMYIQYRVLHYRLYTRDKPVKINASIINVDHLEVHVLNIEYTNVNPQIICRTLSGDYVCVGFGGKLMLHFCEKNCSKQNGNH